MKLSSVLPLTLLTTVYSAVTPFKASGIVNITPSLSGFALFCGGSDFKGDGDCVLKGMLWGVYGEFVCGGSVCGESVCGESVG